MRRHLGALTGRRHDLLVVGAGIYGAWAAWDACLRGLSVAVVDQGDFGAATSAQSLRIVHGGLRYLARGDLPRMRESIRERSVLLRIAPDLVRPLPVLVPTYGVGTQGRLAMHTVLALNDTLSWGRNRHLARSHAIPRGRLLSRAECLRYFPAADPAGLTGGALWYDAQLLRPERLTLGLVLAAAAAAAGTREAGGREAGEAGDREAGDREATRTREAGACGAVAANYVRADRLLVRDGAAYGVRATDILSGAELEIEARSVLIAAGPWTGTLVPLPTQHAFAMNLVLDRRLTDVAAGVRTRSGRRHLFMVPHGTTTLLGTWYALPRGAEAETIARRGTDVLLRELNEACPGLALNPADVLRRQWGWLPLKPGIESDHPDGLAERPLLIDHGQHGGPRGVISMEGVKYTTARRVAAQAIDRVFTILGTPSPPCRTAETPLPPMPAAATLEEEVERAVQDEMAVKLADIMFRRTTLGEPPGPRREVVEAAARAAAPLLGWDEARRKAEIDEVLRMADIPDRTAGIAG